MNGNQLNALIERLQVHDHPKLLEYIMPNKEQNMTMTFYIMDYRLVIHIHHVIYNLDV